ncbi:hypothetical protein QQ045_011884 [Rhodiola kirilowii]
MKSNLRLWFRRTMDKNIGINQKKWVTRLHSCRYIDELFVSVTWIKDIAEEMKSEVEELLQNSQSLDVEKQPNLLPCDKTSIIQFLEIIIRGMNESPAMRVVHKFEG